MAPEVHASARMVSCAMLGPHRGEARRHTLLNDVGHDRSAAPSASEHTAPSRRHRGPTPASTPPTFSHKLALPDQILSTGNVDAWPAGRAGSPEVLAALGRGEEVPADRYFFRTVMRFETGDPGLLWLNRSIAVASAQRRARQVLLEAYRLL